jgi:hypothetical protein
MPTIAVEVDTDANGYFQKTVQYNPPGPFALTVKLAARLLRPGDLTVHGELDIDAADGNPANQAKAFVVKSGDRVDLGSWHLDGRDNVIVLNGRTQPKQANVRLVVAVEASL